MGAAFLVNTAYDFHELDFGWRDNAYASLFYVIIGLHALHVLVGLLMNAIVQAKVLTGRCHAGTPRHARGVRALLALRRRRVDLRVRVPLPLGAHRLMASLRLRAFPDRGFLVWFALTAGIVGVDRAPRRVRRRSSSIVHDHGYFWTLLRSATASRVVVTLHRAAGSRGCWRGPATTARRPARPAGRIRFLGLFGLLVNAINLVLILLEGSYIFFIRTGG